MLRNITNMQEFNRVVKAQFIQLFYNGDKQLYRKARKDDYCKVQLEWSTWLDGLAKSGEITQKQWEKALF